MPQLDSLLMLQLQMPARFVFHSRFDLVVLYLAAIFIFFMEEESNFGVSRHTTRFRINICRVTL